MPPFLCELIESKMLNFHDKLEIKTFFLTLNIQFPDIKEQWLQQREYSYQDNKFKTKLFNWAYGTIIQNN